MRRQKLLTALLALGVLALVTGLGTRVATATTAASEPMSAESPVSSEAEQPSEGSDAEQPSEAESGGGEARPSEPITEPAPDSGSADQGSSPKPSVRPSPGPMPDGADQGAGAGDPPAGRDWDAEGSGRNRDGTSEDRSREGEEGEGSTGGRDSGEGDSSDSTEEDTGSGGQVSGDALLEEVFSPPPVAVPNTVIDSFEIPPFLVPIYQACGTQYGIPWQLLAAINKIETAFGTNLSVSSAGALGWMQFMPGTWAMYGVDANGDGRRDPYNPVDAICSAARYLRAAGGTEHLRDAIFAYNHANWYVEDVLELAQGYSRLPADLIASLTGLTEGAHFPVAANARYADQVTIRKAAGEDGGSGNVAEASGPATERRAVTIFSRPNAPAVAVNDGVIEAIGESDRFGGYVVLRDAFGNRFTYWGLSGVSKVHPVPKRDHLTAEDFEMVTPDGDRMPRKPASRSTGPAEPGLDPESIAASPESAAASRRASGDEARRTTRWAERVARRSAAERGDHEHAASGDGQAGRQEASGDAPDSGSRSDRSGDDHADAEPVNTENARERLFARPDRPNNVGRAIVTGQIGHPVAGDSELQLFRGSAASIVRHDPERFKLERLQEGSRVVAGTMLGRASAGNDDSGSGSVRFAVRPAGDDAPYIDPTPILDGWRLLASTDIYRAKRSNPFFTGIGVSQVLMLPKAALIKRVLNDPRLEIYSCGREDVASGQIDRRVLAVLAYLAERGFRLTVTSLRCGRSGIYTSSGNISNHVGGRAVDIAAINGTPILGNQGPGSLTEAVVQATLRLQGIMLPSELISLHDMGGPSFAMADHADHIHIGYPSPGGESSPSDTPRQVLRPGQWTRLMEQLGRIENPSVPLQPSGAATPATGDDPDAMGSGQ